MKCPICKENEAEKKHPCPYEEDINDNSSNYCKCCDECRDDCIQDI